MENMSSGPKGDLFYWPETGRIDRFHLGDGNQAADDLRANAVQPEIHEAEAKGDTQAKTPVRNICLVLELTDLGLSTHSRFLGALKFTSDPRQVLHFIPAFLSLHSFIPL